MKKFRKISLAFVTAVCTLTLGGGFATLQSVNASGETGNITDDALELPLDSLVENGGLTSIFDTVACIGDSLSSGALEEQSAAGVFAHDVYEYSWGQYMARTLGNTVYNFSKGGMRASIYCESFAEENGYWDEAKACDAYYLALGVNDFYTYPDSIEMGSTADIAEDWADNEKTFAGYMGQIVQRYKEINPDAVFFFITLPSDGDENGRGEIRADHVELMYDLADYFTNSFVIDLAQYGPEYDEEFKLNYYVGGHLSTAGYYLTSKLIMSYTDYLIRHNTQVFRDAGLTIPEDHVHTVVSRPYLKELSALTYEPLTVDQSNSYWCDNATGDMAYFAPQWNIANPGSQNAIALVFTAPADGTITPNVGSIGTFYKSMAGGTDGARLSVFLNDTKIYPTGAELWGEISEDSAAPTLVAASEMTVKQGDKLYYMLDNGGNGASDYDSTYFVPGFFWSDETHSNVWVDGSTGSLGWTDETSGNTPINGLSYLRKDVISYHTVTITREGRKLLPVLNDENEVLLTSDPHDEGLAAVFRSVGLIGGDSLAGAASEMSEILKNNTYDYTMSALTAKDVLGTYGEQQGLWLEENARQAYVLALGESEIASGALATDIAESMTQIVTKLLEVNPHAYFFFVTLPQEISDDEAVAAAKLAHATAMKALAESVEKGYVIDLHAYGTNDSAAEQLVSYIDYIVRRNMYEFKTAGIPQGNPPDYIEEKDDYVLTAEDMTYGPLSIDQSNNYWCGVPEDDLAYFAPQWIVSNPGAEYAVAIAFTAPDDGCVYPDPTTGIGTVYLMASGGDGARFAIYLNNTKIYPAGESLWADVPVGADNALHVDSDAFKMHKGDKLYYVLENGGNGDINFDGTYMVMGFHWTDSTHPNIVWYDSSVGSGGWTDAASGASASTLGYAKNELLSYHYVTIREKSEIPEEPVIPEPPVDSDSSDSSTEPDSSEDSVSEEDGTSSEDGVSSEESSSAEESADNSESASDSQSGNAGGAEGEAGCREGCASTVGGAVAVAAIGLLACVLIKSKKQEE